MAKLFFAFIIAFQFLGSGIANANEKEALACQLNDQAIPQYVKEVRTHIDSCFKKTVMEAVFSIAKRGGYFTPAEGSDVFGIPRYNYKNKKNIPTKEMIESEMSKFATWYWPFYMDSLKKFPELKIIPERAPIYISMEIDKLKARLDFPIVITKGESVYEVKDPYWVEIPCKMTNMYEISLEIAEQKLRDPESTCLSCLYKLAKKHDVKIDFMDTSEGQIFTIKDEESTYLGAPLRFIFGIDYRDKGNILAKIGNSESDNELIQSLPHGEINWSRALIKAKGSAVKPKFSRGALRRDWPSAVKRRAKVDAMRNILETVKTVQVDAEKKLGDIMNESDIMRIRVLGLVQGAIILNTRYYQDKRVEILMAVNLMDILGTLAADELIYRESVDYKKVPFTSDDQGKDEEKTNVKDPGYTGLIVNAKNLGLRPALIPRIIDERGGLVYGLQTVDPEQLKKAGLVGYAKDLNEAMQNDRVVPKPYVISGLKGSGKNNTDVVISRHDAQTIIEKGVWTDYLRKGRVIIVYE